MRLLLAALLCVPLAAQQPQPDPKTAQALTHGQQIAEAISTVTSTAVSPLLGVCVLGAYEHFHTAPEQRHKLPAYTSPWFWTPVALLLVLILFKDTVGGAAPLMKKPLDAVEILMLNKASLVLIAFPVVFHEVAKIMGLDSLGQMFALLPVVHAQDAVGTVQKAGQASVAFLYLLGGLIAAFVVWMAGHAMDVLILLSPFPFLDVLIKGARTALFAVLAACTVFDPKVGALLSAFVILVSLLLSGWAFRLLVFGALFSWDLIRTLVFGGYREPAQGELISGFTARHISGVPKRAFGHLKRRSDGGLEFSHRAWLVGMERTIRLDDAGGYDVGRGLFYPVLMRNSKTMIRLMPRYRKSEEQLVALMGVKAVQDTRFGSGLRAFWQWLRDDEKLPDSAGASAGR